MIRCLSLRLIGEARCGRDEGRGYALVRVERSCSGRLFTMHRVRVGWDVSRVTGSACEQILVGAYGASAYARRRELFTACHLVLVLARACFRWLKLLDTSVSSQLWRVDSMVCAAECKGFSYRAIGFEFNL